MIIHMTKDPSKKYLTAEHFYKFFQCPHWIWYDLYGDQSKKGNVPPLMEMIYKGGLKHERQALASRQFEEIKPELYQDLEEAYMATLELMKQGKNIYHGVLMDKHWVGIPDLLEARPGKSKLGDHYYVVYDIKSGKDIRDEYKFQLAFYTLILEQIQGVRPTEAFIINGDGEDRSFLVEDFLDYFHLNRTKIEAILDGQKPAPFLKSGCKQSPWYSICLSDTEGCNDISLIYRLSQADQKRFYDAGIHTVQDLASADIDDLYPQFRDWNYDKLLRFYNQAQVLMSHEPKFLRKPQFPKVKHEIYFDIESDPTEDIHYMFGILIKSSDKKEPEYKYFWAKDKADEKRIWNEFLDFIDGLDDFVIYHYAFYEKEVFKRLGNAYGVSLDLDTKFREHTIDLQYSVMQSVVLPLYFYSLKDIARFIGFQWKAEDAGGAESVVWYNDWLTTQDKKIKDKIIQYNKDDVLATMHVKEWLEHQKPMLSREKLSEH